MNLIEVLKKSRWQRHQDMIIFSKPKIDFHLLTGNNNSFLIAPIAFNLSFCSFFAKLDLELDEICSMFKCKRIAVLDKINDDNFRSPKISLIRGDSPLVIHVDNHIK